jgi:hypothetical protein
MAVFHTGDIAPDQARALFDVALREILFFAECAKAVAIIIRGLFQANREFSGHGRLGNVFVSILSKWKMMENGAHSSPPD